MSIYKDKRTGKIMIDPVTSQYVRSGLKNAKELKATVERLKVNLTKLGNSARKAKELLSFYEV